MIDSNNTIMILDVENLDQEKKEEVDRYHRIMEKLKKENYDSYSTSFRDIMPLIHVSEEVGFYQEESNNLDIHFLIIFNDYPLTKFAHVNEGTVVMGKLLYEALKNLKKMSSSKIVSFEYIHDYPLVCQSGDIVCVVAPVIHHSGTVEVKKCISR